MKLKLCYKCTLAEYKKYNIKTALFCLKFAYTLPESYYSLEILYLYNIAKHSYDYLYIYICNLHALYFTSYLFITGPHGRPAALEKCRALIMGSPAVISFLCLLLHSILSFFPVGLYVAEFHFMHVSFSLYVTISFICMNVL